MVVMSVTEEDGGDIWDNFNKKDEANGYTTKVYRYSRATLFSFRNSKHSIKKPECFFTNDLNSLSCWKVAVAKNDKNRVQSKMKFYPSTVKRSEDNKYVGNNAKQKVENSFEHRSLSSAHLLPAFAKRRLMSSSEVNNTELTNTTDGCESLSRKEKEENANKSITLNSGGDKAERKKSPEYSENLNQRFNNNSPSPSAFKSGSQNNERRIGSGRFLPRAMGWDENIEEMTYEESYTHDMPVTRSSNLNHYHNQETNKNELKDKLISNTPSNDAPRRNSRRYSSKSKENIENLTNSHHKINFDKNKRYPVYNENNEEPEWFSEGPTSKLDTIELRGFDESDEKNSYSSESNELIETNISKIPLEKSTDVSCRENSVDNNQSAETEPKKKLEDGKLSFNIEKFLTIDALPNPIMNIETQYGGDSSRFRQWFQSASDETNKTNELYHERSIELAGSKEEENKAFLDFLKAGNITQTVSIHKPFNVHSIPSVEELEARMKKIDLRTEHEIGRKNSKDDMEAFNRFLSQLNGSSTQSLKAPYCVEEKVQHVDQRQQGLSSALNKNIYFHPQQNSENFSNFVNSSGSLLVPSNDTPGEVNGTHIKNGMLFNSEVIQQSSVNVNAHNICDSTKNVQEGPGGLTACEKKNIQQIGQNNQLYSSSFSSPDITRMLNESSSVEQISTPSPLSFTPTSVLRKMTAEKEISQSQTQAVYKLLAETDQLRSSEFDMQEKNSNTLSNFMPRMILGGNCSNLNLTQQQEHLGNVFKPQQVVSLPVMQHTENLKTTKPLGRPILKGNLHNIQVLQQPQVPQNYFLDSKIDYSYYQNELLMRRNQYNSQVLMSHQFIQSNRGFDSMCCSINNADRQQVSDTMICKNFDANEYPEMAHNNGGIIKADQIDANKFIDSRSIQQIQWCSPNAIQPRVCKQPFEMNSPLTLEQFEKNIKSHPSTIVNN